MIIAKPSNVIADTTTSVEAFQKQSSIIFKMDKVCGQTATLQLFTLQYMIMQHWY